MGYYTHFESGVTGPKVLLEKLYKDAENGETFGEYDMPLEDFVNDDLFGGDTAKWYGWETDIKALSAKYPALLFSLEGEGEEAGDIWKAWARNGKSVSVQARIVFDEPDLDTILPSPDVAAAVEAAKEETRNKLRAEIDALKVKLESI